ncbi:MAG: response regulator transcription factor [Peptoniphilus harei]|uniref:response regulator transcription factor n=1 Tax=Peptoniphilus harei TaxID=54005 RepID=UPI00189890C9|nr:response regulator transcription factor [Peptoniphilus harei]MDK7754755.1 response regulator transcription factor [Peptoniphilus harei]MDK7760561.1 response regulator transcription factor [Peptoniphilus harei]MDK8270352.1 response regulator transcription factor [Peptoniphilus harei]MDK8338811.1 response regulator transcription factor [Peptoniphilus harei]
MKILLLDDHKIFGESLKVLLEERGISCTYTSSIKNFYEEVEGDYDIILLDINLKEEETGFDILDRIHDKNKKIVILTSYDMINYKRLALEKGAIDFINKSLDVDEVIERLEKVYKDEKISFDDEEKTIEPLTKREEEILLEVLSGLTKKEIADKLYISERTLYNHLANIYAKLGAKNAIEAYKIALELGYIRPLM